MIPAEDRKRGRYVVEIALNVDLMMEGNGAERIDTLLHEMAHVADYLFDGNYGHGESWKSWARHAGCRAETKYDRSVVRRRRRRQAITRRVPPLPPALRRSAA
jgi:predicted SprT family Zn-dependent metalloprotease